MFALLSAWIALGAFVTSLLLVFTRLGGKEAVMTLLPYTVAVSVTLAAAVLWAFRKRPVGDPGIAGQRLQALAAIALNSLTFAILLFWINGITNGFLGLVLEYSFLYVIYWLYTRVLVPEK